MWEKDYVKNYIKNSDLKIFLTCPFITKNSKIVYHVWLKNEQYIGHSL